MLTPQAREGTRSWRSATKLLKIMLLVAELFTAIKMMAIKNVLVHLY